MAESEAAKEQRRAYWTRICRAEFGAIVDGVENVTGTIERTVPLFYDDAMSQANANELTARLEMLEMHLRALTGMVERVRYHLADYAKADKLDPST